MAGSVQVVAPQGRVAFRIRLAAVSALACLVPLAVVTSVGLWVFLQLTDTAAGQAELTRAYYTFANTVLLLDLAMVFLASAAGLDQIAIGMGDINEAAQQSASGAEHSQQAAQDLAELAGEFLESLKGNEKRILIVLSLNIRKFWQRGCIT